MKWRATIRVLGKGFNGWLKALFIIGLLSAPFASPHESHAASQISYEFSTNGNQEGWTSANMTTTNVSNGILGMDPAGSDPYIYSPNLTLSAGSYRYIEIKMASNALDGNGAVYFKTSGDSWYSETKKVAFSVSYCSQCGNASYYTYTVDMWSNSYWTGTITGIRVDPADNGKSGTSMDAIGIDYIRLNPVNSPPNNPTVLSQYKSDQTTEFSAGGSTNETTVVMKGNVSDPDSDTVQLEVEVKLTTQSFTGSPSSNCQSGVSQSSGGRPHVTCSSLSDGSYHWQARAKDSKGNYSGWVGAGNADPSADFIVSTVNPILQISTDNASWSTSASAQQLATFYIKGSSYTSNGTLTRYITKPGGTTETLTPTLSADSSGNVSWTWTSVCTSDLGTSTIWVVDSSSGKSSNTVSQTLSTSASCNNSPYDPSSLSQYKTDGTSITAGGTTNESSIKLRGYVSDPDGNQVKLQVELRTTSESFTGNYNHESGYVSSGSTAELTVSGLTNGDYQWRGRTVDSNGKTSSWIDAENSGADFVVSLSSPATLIQKSGDYKVYYVSGTTKYHIPDPETFEILGFSWSGITTVTQSQFDGYTTGAAIPVLGTAQWYGVGQRTQYTSI